MNLDSTTKVKLFDLIYAKLAQKSDKVYIIRLLDYLFSYQQDSKITKFLIKNVDDIKWNSVVYAINVMDRMTTELFFPIFYIFETKIRNKELNKYLADIEQIITNSCQNLNLANLDRAMIDRIIIDNNKKIFKFYQSKQILMIKNKLEFLKKILKINQKNAYSLSLQYFDIGDLKLELDYNGINFFKSVINHIALSQLIRSNTNTSTESLLTLFKIRNILVHSESIFLLNEKNSKMIQTFLGEDLKTLLKEHEFETVIIDFQNYLAKLRKDLLVNKAIIKTEKNTNFIIERILIFYINQFIPKIFNLN